MSLLRSAQAILILTVKWRQQWLTLAVLLGLTASVALIASVPLYADAVYSQILQEEAIANRRTYSPFALLFCYLGAQDGPITWPDTRPVDAFFVEHAGSMLGLSQRLLVRFFRTDEFLLFPADRQDASLYKMAEALASMSFGYQSDLQEHIAILEGHFPGEGGEEILAMLHRTSVREPLAQNDREKEEGGEHITIVEVLISKAIVASMGFEVGETYIAYASRSTGQIERDVQIPVRIAGVWEPADRREEYWFHNPVAVLDNVLLVPEETFHSVIGLHEDKEVHAGLWYLGMEESGFRVSDVDGFLDGLDAVQRRAAALLPGTALTVSPVRNALQRYQRAAGLLAVSLYAFSIPILGILLAFIGLVSDLSVRQQRNEIATLRGRGATASQVVGIAALESILLGAIAVAGGLSLAIAVARWMGRAYGFLAFAVSLSTSLSTRSGLQVDLNLSAVLLAVGATVLALAMRVSFTIRAARHTIVTYKQDRARAQRPPWWQRAWLDILLFIPAGYGAYLLGRGGLALPASDALIRADGEPVTHDAFYRNPLLFLVPALWMLVLTLFTLHILPLILDVAARVAARTKGTSILLATRHLARTPESYTASLMLLVLTLSLSAFTASMAGTLDRHLYELKYYQVGADMRLVELGEDAQEAALRQRVREGDRSALDELAALDAPGKEGMAFLESDREADAPRWSFLPVSEHLAIPGVRAAARVGQYEASLGSPAPSQPGSGGQPGTFIGIDRVDFPHVAFWRQDFAPSSLGALMNALALDRDGVLLPRAYMDEHGLALGDVIRVQVTIREQRRTVTSWTVDLDLRIVGSFDLFPTWYPQDAEGRYEPLLVGNLENLFEQANAQFPYDVWLETEPGTDYEQVKESAQELGIRVMGEESPIPLIIRDLRRPERQGLFGLLSIGFVASAVLATLGFLFYALFSFRRRFVEIGVLRAIGLSVRQMAMSVVWELLILILVALGAGTGIGTLASVLFIPDMQVGAGPTAGIPPFAIEIAWRTILRVYALYGLLFLAGAIALTALLLRMRYFEAIKLGETT